MEKKIVRKLPASAKTIKVMGQGCHFVYEYYIIYFLQQSYKYKNFYNKCLIFSFLNYIILL